MKDTRVPVRTDLNLPLDDGRIDDDSQPFTTEERP
jgi:3-phosphoglycerate kinase